MGDDEKSVDDDTANEPSSACPTSGGKTDGAEPQENTSRDSKHTGNGRAVQWFGNNDLKIADENSLSEGSDDPEQDVKKHREELKEILEHSDFNVGPDGKVHPDRGDETEDCDG